MDWRTFAVSTVTAVIVAFLGPRFQHIVWRNQRLREQQITVVERFAKIGTSFHVFMHSSPIMQSSERVIGTAELFIEQFAILTLVMALFRKPKTLLAARSFKQLLDEGPPFTPPIPEPDGFQRMNALSMARAELTACLFSEAFDLPSK